MSLSSDPTATYDVEINESKYRLRFPTSRQWRRTVEIMTDARNADDSLAFYDRLIPVVAELLEDWNGKSKGVDLEDAFTFGELMTLGNEIVEGSTTAELQKKTSESQQQSTVENSATNAQQQSA